MKRFTFWEDFLSLVFPRTCCVCKRSLFSFENQLCKLCEAKLPIASYHLRPQNNELKIKILGLAEPNLVMSFLRFTKKGMSQKLLHQLKYRNKPELGIQLGRIYGELLKSTGFQDHWEVILPVPLHPMKIKRRGYNQSEKFACGLSEILDIRLGTELIRVKMTETQTKKSRLERLVNVQDAFKVNDVGSLQNKNVLLVDDVLTTGATLAACANVLYAAGAKSVDFAVIAAGGQ
ncbi:ComF family protein [Pararhodonellum marinum]|jgi:ComF family protein|uniref:ComF family protein n=1 Tax=Pararhodonellum marinum TaxID=2755358 RepID=UPI00188FEEC1|nr:ComF family protein [Pararhodonellum marinum]